jgi:hypothetical protein
MTTPPTAMMVVWLDFPPEDEARINHWYDREHVATRVAMPGFLWGRRFVATDGAPKYVAVYACEGLEALRSAPYLRLISEPDAAEAEHVVLFRNGIRALCTVAAQAGDFEGGIIGLLGLDEGAEGGDLGPWLAETVLPELVAAPGITAARLLRTEHEMIKGASSRFTPDTIRPPDWVVVIEARDGDAAGAARQGLLAAEALAAHGAGADQRFGIYRQTLRVGA